MNEENVELFDALTEYKDRLEDIDHPDEVESVLENILNAISHDETIDPDELEVVADFVRDFDLAYPESDELLDIIKVHQERLH
ncbi:MAG: hypothetical protein QY316_03805 [Thermodesulfobacteriota bacterium]|nr:MAG: hypothetical protein QY316_03805 [Thermodesulfobacteriota bacterium]